MAGVGCQSQFRALLLVSLDFNLAQQSALLSSQTRRAQKDQSLASLGLIIIPRKILRNILRNIARDFLSKQPSEWLAV